MALGVHSVPRPGPALDGPGATLAAARDGRVEFLTPRSNPPRPIPAAGLVAIVDVLIVLSAFVAMIIGINLDQMPNGLDAFLALRITVKNAIVVSGFVAAIAVVLHGAGLYDASRVRRWGDEVRRLLLATIGITVIAAVVPLTGQSRTEVDRWSIVLFAVTTLVALVAFRGLRARLTHDARRRRVLIIGSGPRAIRIYRALCADFQTPYRVLGFVDSPNAAVGVPNSFIGRRTLGRLEDLETLLVGEHVDEVYVGCPSSRTTADSEHDWDVRAPRREGALPRRYLRYRARQAAHADRVGRQARTCSCRWRPKAARSRQALHRCRRRLASCWCSWRRSCSPRPLRSG